MKKKNAEEIRFWVDKHYVTWIGTYGLKDALRICTGLKRRLTEEKKRRPK